MAPDTHNLGDGRPHVMRVYSRLEVGGIEHQMLSLLPRLNSGRYRVSLCLLKRAGELAGELRARGIEVHVVPFRGRLRPSGLFSLAGLFRRTRTHIVHAHARSSITSATVAARLARVPVVIGALHSVDTVQGRRRIAQERLFARLRDATIAVSEGVKRNYCAAIGLDSVRVSVIYNGVDLSRFDGPPPSPAERAALLGPLGVAPADCVITCVARLVPAKSHDVLLDAFARFLARIPQATLLLVGDGPLAADLEEQTRRLGIAARVVFAGARDDVPRILRASDISVLSSQREGFSNVVIESLAAGLPVVATDVGGNAEAIAEGSCGLLVPVGDAAAISERLGRLAEDHGLRARMSAAARRRASAFSLDEAVRATETLYDGLLRARGLSGGRS